MKKTALITGITGQDGSYLAELLLSKGYIVWGIIRRSASPNTGRIDHIFDQVHLEYGDMTDSSRLITLIKKIRPHEIYHLAAQSHVRVSFDTPEDTCKVDGLGILRILEALRICDLVEHTRVYNASTSEQFGLVTETPQNERTPFHPRSPYGCAKLLAHSICVNYREAYGIYVVNGILFNHGSPRRGITFVESKVCKAVAQIQCGISRALYLGNLDAKRDWGHAKDYVQAMWLMLQQDEPEDYVIATNEMHTVRDLVETAFKVVHREITWKDSGTEEIGVDTDTGEVLIRIDERYYRPSEVDVLCGDYSKALKNLGWKPTVTFDDLVKEMVEHEMSTLSSSIQKTQVS